MSALGQKRTCAAQYVMSALPPAQKRARPAHRLMSALGQKRTLSRPSRRHVRAASVARLFRAPWWSSGDDLSRTWLALAPFRDAVDVAVRRNGSNRLIP